MLSVIVPAYNEEERLLRTLEALRDYRKQYLPITECIVIDDGSVDNTADIAQAFAQSEKWCQVISLPKNMGKGWAVRAGVLKANGDYIVFMDADLSTSLKNLKPAIQLLSEGVELVIGSRVLPETIIDKPQPIIRRLTARFGNRLIRHTTKLPYYDTQCGFKGFQRSIARNIFQHLNTRGYMFDVEILVYAATAGYNVVELAVKWEHQPGGNFRLPANLLAILRDLKHIRSQLR